MLIFKNILFLKILKISKTYELELVRAIIMDLRVTGMDMIVRVRTKRTLGNIGETTPKVREERLEINYTHTQGVLVGFCCFMASFSCCCSPCSQAFGRTWARAHVRTRRVGRGGACATD